MPPPTPRQTRRANRAAATSAATAEPEEADDFGTPSGAGGGVDRQATPASLADLAALRELVQEQSDASEQRATDQLHAVSGGLAGVLASVQAIERRLAAQEAAPTAPPPAAIDLTAAPAPEAAVGVAGAAVGVGGGPGVLPSPAPAPAPRAAPPTPRTVAELDAEAATFLAGLQEIEEERALVSGRSARTLWAVLQAHFPGTSPALPVGVPSPCQRTPFARSEWAYNPDQLGSFNLPRREELVGAAYLPNYGGLVSDAAKDEFDTLYFSVARAEDVWAAVASTGPTQTALQELREVHDFLKARVHYLLDKCEAKAPGSNFHLPVSEVEAQWVEKRYARTYIPYITAESRAERADIRKRARDAEIAAAVKYKAKLAVEQRLAALRKKTGSKTPHAPTGGAGA